MAAQEAGKQQGKVSRGQGKQEEGSIMQLAHATALTALVLLVVLAVGHAAAETAPEAAAPLPAASAPAG